MGLDFVSILCRFLVKIWDDKSLLAVVSQDHSNVGRDALLIATGYTMMGIRTIFAGAEEIFLWCVVWGHFSWVRWVRRMCLCWCAMRHAVDPWQSFLQNSAMCKWWKGVLQKNLCSTDQVFLKFCNVHVAESYSRRSPCWDTQSCWKFAIWLWWTGTKVRRLCSLIHEDAQVMGYIYATLFWGPWNLDLQHSWRSILVFIGLQSIVSCYST